MLCSRIRERVTDASRNDTSEEDSAFQQSVDLELALLPYNLKAAHAAVLKLEGSVRRVAGEHAHRPPGGWMLVEDDWLPLAWAVDDFLGAGRRAQDALIRVVGQTFRRPLPSSIAKLFENEGKYSRGIPPSVLDLLRSYWSKHGLTLKAYRDMAEHRTIVSSDMFVFISPPAVPAIRLLLPNDPFEPAAKRITYDVPYTHATAWCRQALVALFEVASQLEWLLLRHFPFRSTGTMSVLRHPLAADIRAASIPLPSDDLVDALWRVREDVSRLMPATYGDLEDPPLRPPGR